jgi:amino acid adenylation domain-containing protein
MLLAVLKTGAAYVPLDPHHPTDRLEYIIGDAAARIVIAEESSLLPKAATRDVLLRADLEREAEGESTEDIERDVHAESASYLIYTSGSTGRPKGVVVTHRALSSLLSAMTSLLDVTSADRWLALTTLSFDIATLEWLLPLTVGAQVIMAGREEASEGRALREIAVRHGATIIQATPSMWRTILASGDLPQTLRLALCGGEAMSAALANRLRKRPVRKVWNLYGPTETTIWSTAHELADAEYRNSPPIGQPLSNTRVYVLNDDLEPAPENGEGELYIGGHGLAQGYMGSPDLTAERFVPDPFASARGARLYRTGDLVRLTSARELEFIGRKDDQVKVRGHRIELGEVEAEICRSVGIAEAAVICRPDDSGDSSLVAYFVAERNVPVWTSELRSLLQSRLPEYMIPSGFVEVRELPLTPNGKTDRRALAALAQRPSDEQRAPYVAPRTGTEETLARIWADVLKIQRVGGEDDFFDIGGHSLLAVEIILRIEEATQKRLTLLQLFENSTLSAFAGVIDRLVPTGQGSKAYELEP